MSLDIALSPMGQITGTMVIFTLTFIVCIALKKVYSFWRFYQYFQAMPGDKTYSIIQGNLSKMEYEQQLEEMRLYMTNVNPRIRRFWLGPYEPLIILLHPDLVSEFLKKSTPKTTGFGGGYEHAIPWLGNSVLTSNGAKWQRDRRLINMAFHHSVLKNYIAVFNDAAGVFTSILDGYAERGESFDIMNLACLCAYDIITRSTMNINIDAQRQKHPYVNAARTLTSGWALRNKTVTLWPNILFRLSEVGQEFFKTCSYVHGVARDIIQMRKEAMDSGIIDDLSKRHPDFLDMLLQAKDEDGTKMTPEEIREHVDAIMFAGHDTAGATIGWFLLQMALHQDYQTRIQTEVDDIFADKADTNDYITFEDLSHLSMLTMCLKESSRINPAVPVLSRRIQTEMKFDQHRIPPGTVVCVPIIHVQRNPTVWENPLEYVPQRFSSENASKIPSGAYLPFSSGSRNCAGQNFAMMELKVILSRLLRRFTFEQDPNGPPVERIYGVVLKAKHGIWMKVKRRLEYS